MTKIEELKKYLEKEFHHEKKKKLDNISYMSRLQPKRPNYLTMSHLIPNLIIITLVKKIEQISITYQNEFI